MTAITNHLPTAELQALDAAHHMHPFTENGALAKKGARSHDNQDVADAVTAGSARMRSPRGPSACSAS